MPAQSGRLFTTRRQFNYNCADENLYRHHTERRSQGARSSRKCSLSKRSARPSAGPRAANIHLTLKFIGEVDDGAGRRGSPRRWPRPGSPVAPFQLRIRRLRQISRRRRPAYFLGRRRGQSAACWPCSTASKPPCCPLGVARETRPFQPHLTLGRNKARYRFRGAVRAAGRKAATFFSANARSTPFSSMRSRPDPVRARSTRIARRSPLSSHEIFFIVFSYLLGSIPFGYLIFYFSEGKDIRTMGSGNIGATNVLRSKGKLAGLATLALDIAQRGAADHLRPHPFRPALDRPAGRPGRAAGPRLPGVPEIPRRQGRRFPGRRFPGLLLSRPAGISGCFFPESAG